MKLIIARIISNAQTRQKDGFKNMFDAVKRRTIVAKTVGLCKMLDIKKRDNAVSLKDAFEFWKSQKSKRAEDLLRKYCLNWMNRTRIGY